MKRLVVGLSLVLSAGIAVGQTTGNIPFVTTGVVYLSCSMGEGYNADKAFEYSLNEAAGTVTDYRRKDNVVSVGHAFFGSDSVVWSANEALVSKTRAFNRTSLSYVEEDTVAGKLFQYAGVCQVVTPPVGRKF